MKKLILIAVISLVGYAASAQVSTYNMISKYGLSKDTVTNTGTDSLKVVCSQSYKTITIQPTVTKISGTMTSNSTPQLYGSVDGAKYYAITGDTLHITNTSSKIQTNWTLSSQQYKVYKIVWTGAGTMSAKMEAIFQGFK